MTDISSHLCIPANPDISGVGVRIAIYAQNILSFGPAIWALWDGKVTAGELDSIETQSMTILITAFSVLVSAIVQALSHGLSKFHISLILDLSWMNNTSTFIYFLLYIRHKTQTERDNGQEPMELKWPVWIRYVAPAFRRSPSASRLPYQKALSLPTNVHQIRAHHWVYPPHPHGRCWNLVLESPHQFQRHPVTQPCTPPPTILFGDVPITSVAIYSIFILPLVNPILPTCGLLAIQIYWPRLSTWMRFKQRTGVSSPSSSSESTSYSDLPISRGWQFLEPSMCFL